MKTTTLISHIFRNYEIVKNLMERNDAHQLILLLDSFENLKNIAYEYLDRSNVLKESEV